MADYELTKQDESNANDPRAPNAEEPLATEQKNPSKRKRCIVIIGIVLVLLIFLLLIVIIVVGVKLSAAKKALAEEVASTPCLTTNCITTVSDLMAAVDPTVNPCEDFPKYACGRWPEKNPRPDDRTTWTPLGKLGSNNQQLIQRLIKRKDTRIRYTRNEALNKLFTFYDSCMDLSAIEALGKTPIINFYKKMNLFPELNPSWNESTWDFNTLLSDVQRSYSPSVFFQIWVNIQDSNSSVHGLGLYPGGIGLQSSRYNSTDKRNMKIKKSYKDNIVRLMKLIGLSQNKSVEIMESIMSVEFDIATLSAGGSEGKTITIKELDDADDTKEKQINWMDFFTRCFQYAAYNPSLSTKIETSDTSYFKKINRYLYKAPKRDLANYMSWRMLSHYSNLLSKDFRNSMSEYYKVFRGDVPPTPRWERCIAETKAYFGMAVGRMFVDVSFRNGSKEEATELVDDIKKLFILDFDQVEWMDEQTKAAAKTKAHAIFENIGYPEFIMDNAKLANLYKMIDVKNNTYFDNSLDIEAFESSKTLNSMGKLVDKQEWSISPTTINAVYAPQTNSMDIPAGILQKPLFHFTYPSSINYGAIGAIIGHEMTHGFDNFGRTYNQYGNIKKWWSNSSIANFESKAQCFVSQYSNFTYMGMNLNGANVLGEVIADNGGTEIAYKAYMHWVEKHGKEKKLPGIKHTHEQIFFIAYAQIFCSSYAESTIKDILQGARHPINPLRVKGVVMNSVEFAKAYKCPVGSPMNPAKKCKVW